MNEEIERIKSPKEFFRLSPLKREFIIFKNYEDSSDNKTDLLMGIIISTIIVPAGVYYLLKEIFKKDPPPFLQLPASWMDEFNIKPGKNNLNSVFVVNPVDANQYISFEEYHTRVFESKYFELISMLASLGATEIDVEHIEGYTRDAGINLSAPIPTKLGNINSDVRGKTNSTQSKKIIYKSELPGHVNPVIHDNPAWYNYEAGWRLIAEKRIKYYTNSDFVDLEYNNENHINAELAAQFQQLGFKIGLGFSKNKYQKTTWKIHVKFKKKYDTDEEEKADKEKFLYEEQERIKKEERRLKQKEEERKWEREVAERKQIREEKEKEKKEEENRQRIERNRLKYEEEQRNQRIIGIVSVVSAIAILGMAVAFYFYKSSTYDSKSILEKERIYNDVSLIDKLISEKKFIEASQKINSDLKWNVKESFLLFGFSGSDEKKTMELNLNKDFDLLNGVKGEITQLCKQEMDDVTYKTAYDYITFFNGIYERFGSTAKDKYEKFAVLVNEELDQSRHSYLEKLTTNIKIQIELNNLDSASIMLPNIYHYSGNNYKSKLLGLFNTNYKEYWGKQKEEIAELIKEKKQ